MQIIAKSQERESFTEDGVVWWKEYALYKDLYRTGWRVFLRYMGRVGGKVYPRENGRLALFTDPEAAWEAWGYGDTPEQAIEDVIGDSDFSAAISLDPLHAEAAARLKEARAANKRRQALQDRYNAAVGRLNDWKRHHQQLFTKRHGHKEGDAYQKAFDRTKKRLQPEHDRLLAEVEDAKKALKS